MELTRRRAATAAGLVLAGEAATLVTFWFVDRSLVQRGYGDEVDALTEPWMWLIMVAVISPAAVGFLILRSHPRHPVGWLFLGLSIALLTSGLLDEWFTFAAIVEPAELGGAQIAAVLANLSFVPWWPLLTLILLLTPTGTHLSPRWRLVGQASLVAAVIMFVASVVDDRPLNQPYAQVGRPGTVTAVADVAGWISLVAMAVMALALVLGGTSLLVRWRRARDDDRRRLLWLALAAVPLPAVVPVHLFAVSTDNEAFIGVTAALFLLLIPLAAGLSVLRYRLYDVDRIVATTFTYSLLSLMLTGVYAAVVWAGSHASAVASPSPAATATVGAVAAATLFAPLRGGVQRRVDRQFNRRAYDAVRQVRTVVSSGGVGVDPEGLLREALADPALCVAYPGAGGWVDASGESVTVPPEHVDVTKGGRTVAKVGFDPAATESSTVARAAAFAVTELDNTRLRADLRRHLAELAESRARIADAQREERRRIERDLHDGAQQTLLALAFELQSAQLNGDPDRMRAALISGATSARDAARELRDLANGLHPQALVEGGLGAVLDDLARRSPVPVAVRADVGRLDPATEFTAWLVVAEAVVNAQKHAAAALISVDLLEADGELRIGVTDDGCGGADPDSSGLRGLRDRVDAAAGRLSVTSGARGTKIEVVLPCGS